MRSLPIFLTLLFALAAPALAQRGQGAAPSAPPQGAAPTPSAGAQGKAPAQRGKAPGKAPAKRGGGEKAPAEPNPASAPASVPPAPSPSASPKIAPPPAEVAPQPERAKPVPPAAPPSVTPPPQRARPDESEVLTVSALRERFRSADTDGDGVLALREIASTGLGRREHTLGDVDGDHGLSEAEFLGAYAAYGEKQGLKLAPELAAMARTTASSPQVLQPSSTPVAPPSRSTAAQRELENKIEEALRKNLGDKYVPRVVETPAEPVAAPASSAPAETSPEVAPENSVAQPPSPEERAAQLRASLELRLTESQASPDEARAARARLEQRILELAAGEATKPPPGSRRDPTRSPDERDRELRESLEAKLKADFATPEQAANARARLEERIAQMRAKDAERAAAEESEESGELLDSASAARSFEERAREQRDALERELATSGATPEAAAKARAELEQRLAALAKRAGPKPPPGSRRDPTRSPEERDRELRASLEAKLAADGATPEQATNARARLEERIAQMRAKDVERAQDGTAPRAAGSGTTARVEPKSPAPAPQLEPAPQIPPATATEGTPTEPAEAAPTLTPEQSLEARARNLRDALERQLADSGASPEEAAVARERLERRIADMQRAAQGERKAAGGAGQGGKKKRDGGG
jgi:hypothetical protein